MKKSTSISIRLAAAMTAGALAACGGGAEPATGAPPPVAGAPAPVGTPSAAPVPVPVPAPARAPEEEQAPAPAPSTPQTPAPAPAYVPDRLKGKNLYETGGTTLLPCENCHGPNPAISNAAPGADWTRISQAIWNEDPNNLMRVYRRNPLTETGLTGLDMQDIAAYIANPTP